MFIRINEITEFAGIGYVGGAVEVEAVSPEGAVIATKRLSIVEENSSIASLILLNTALSMVQPGSISHVEFYSFDSRKGSRYIISVICQANNWMKEGFRNNDGDIRANTSLVQEFLSIRDSLGVDSEGEVMPIDIMIEDFNATGDRKQGVLRLKAKLSEIASKAGKDALIKGKKVSGDVFATPKEA